MLRSHTNYEYCQNEAFSVCFKFHFQDDNGQLNDSPYFLIHMCKWSAFKDMSYM